jgi:hypothetical protein
MEWEALPLWTNYRRNQVWSTQTSPLEVSNGSPLTNSSEFVLSFPKKSQRIWEQKATSDASKEFHKELVSLIWMTESIESNSPKE